MKYTCLKITKKKTNKILEAGDAKQGSVMWLTNQINYLFANIYVTK